MRPEAISFNSPEIQQAVKSYKQDHIKVGIGQGFFSALKIKLFTSKEHQLEALVERLNRPGMSDADKAAILSRFETKEIVKNFETLSKKISAEVFIDVLCLKSNPDSRDDLFRKISRNFGNDKNVIEFKKALLLQGEQTVNGAAQQAFQNPQGAAQMAEIYSTGAHGLEPKTMPTREPPAIPTGSQQPPTTSDVPPPPPPLPSQEALAKAVRDQNAKRSEAQEAPKTTPSETSEKKQSSAIKTNMPGLAAALQERLKKNPETAEHIQAEAPKAAPKPSIETTQLPGNYTAQLKIEIQKRLDKIDLSQSDTKLADEFIKIAKEYVPDGQSKEGWAKAVDEHLEGKRVFSAGNLSLNLREVIGGFVKRKLNLTKTAKHIAPQQPASVTSMVDELKKRQAKPPGSK